MNKSTTYKIRLGIFIFFGIAALMIGIYFIGERQQLFRNTFRVSGIFNDVGGLQAGNNVRFSGINIGTVEKIDIISESSVQVDIRLDEGTRKYIKKDAIGSIGSEGLMGNKIFIITPGPGKKKKIENNDFIETVQPINLDDVLLSLKTTIDNASNITRDLSLITNNIQSGKGIVGNLLMDQTMAENFNSSIVNLNQGSAGLKNLMDDAKISFDQNFDSTLVNLRESSNGFRLLMEKAKSSWLLWGF